MAAFPVSPDVAVKITISFFTLFYNYSYLLGIILPLAVLIDLLLDKNRQSHPKDSKTDWFYNNKKYDMEKDERSDKNNYRTL